MSIRKEVFQAKVLQRLYSAPVPESDQLPKPPVYKSDSVIASKSVQLKPNKDTVGALGLSGKKVYTVLPPPEDYRPPSGEENPEPISTADRVAVDLSSSGHSDVTEDEDHGRKRRKRRRKRKADDARVGEMCTSVQNEDTAQGQEEENRLTFEVPKGQERLSKSKRRKLKKKRQKEKLRSLGLVPQSRALEFTYRQDGGKDEEEDEEQESDEGNRQNVEEIVDFLQTTLDIYLSDRSSTAASTPLSPSTAQSLFTNLSAGTVPPAAVSGLYRLRALLGLKDVEQLNMELQEFRHTSILSPDETVLVCTLFHYWMTEVLSMQVEKKA